MVTVERVVTATGSFSTATPTVIPTPAGPRRLVICQVGEPASLYPLAAATPQALNLAEALYDGLIDARAYQYQPVALTRLPSPAGGDAGLDDVEVGVGAPVFDLATQSVVTISTTTRATLAQIGGGALEVDFSRTPTARTVQQWAQWTQVDGLTWEDGTPVTSADALFAFAMASSPATPTAKDVIAATAAYQAVDDQTVRWTGVPGYQNAAYFRLHWGFLPQHAFGRLTAEQMLTDDAVNFHPLAYGPFKLAEWIGGDYIRLVRNPTYWRTVEGLPRLDEVIIRFFASADGVMAQLVSGQCDVGLRDPAYANHLPLLRQMEGQGLLLLHLVPDPAYEQISFNAQPAEDYDGFAALARNPDGTPIFANPAIRQAIAHCIDRQALIDVALNGAGFIQHTYAAPNHPLYAGDDNLTRYAFDPARGLALLAEAGWTDTDGNGLLDDGRGHPFSIVHSTRLTAARRALTSLIQEQLRANCQIETHIDLYGSEYFATGRSSLAYGRRFDLSQLLYRNDASEPLCNVYTTADIPGDANGWSRLNMAGYSNPDFDATCAAALQAGDPAAKAAAHAQAQAIWSRDLPAVVLYAPASIMLTRSAVQNVIMDSTARSDLWNIENFDQVP